LVFSRQRANRLKKTLGGRDSDRRRRKIKKSIALSESKKQRGGKKKYQSPRSEWLMGWRGLGGVEEKVQVLVHGSFV